MDWLGRLTTVKSIEGTSMRTAKSVKNLITAVTLFLLTSCSSDPQPKLTLTLSIDGTEKVNASAVGNDEIEKLMRNHGDLIASMDSVCSTDRYEVARSNLKQYLTASFSMQRFASYIIKHEIPIEGFRPSTEELSLTADFDLGKFACATSLNG